jgi:predicted RND superfamily exporter protein
LAFADRLDRFWSRYATWVIERHRGLLALYLASTIACAPLSVLLYLNLRTDLRELLPQDAPAVVHLRELEKRLGFLGLLMLVVRTEDLEAGERFVDALGTELRGMPKSVVRAVDWRVEDQRIFFDRFGALYADYDDLVLIRDRIKDRARREKERVLTVSLEDDDQPPSDFSDVLAKYTHRRRDVDRFPDGYYAGENGKTLVMMIYPPSVGTDSSSNRALLETVERTVARLDPKSFHPSIFVAYSGEVADSVQEQGALIRDLVVSSILVLIAVALVIAGYYRLKRSLVATFLPLTAGAMWTLALSYLAIGHLNPNTAFLGSIIVGNGINYGLILLARYLEERRSGASIERALPLALSRSWLATWTAAIAASCSYVSLGATSFRGFNEFGVMGGSGMVLCWIATYLAMPPLLVWLERRAPLDGGSPLPWLFNHVARLVERAPGAIVFTCLLVSAISIAAVAIFFRDPIEYDFSKLSSRTSAREGSDYWSTHANAVLQRYVTPTVIMTDRPEEAAKVAGALEDKRRREEPTGLIDAVRTLQDYLPNEQERKLPVLAEIKSLLTDQVIESLPADRRRDVKALVGRAELRPVTLGDLPEPLLRSLTELDGHRDLLVLAFPKLSITERRGTDVLPYVRSIRATAQEAEPGVRVAGSMLLTSDILSTMIDDGQKAAILSFLSVVALVFLVFRSFSASIGVLSALLLGMLWMGGVIGLFDLKLNFLNFVTIPITVGIGVDYGVNIYQRYAQEGPGTITRVVEHTGGAVALCSLTTVIGYSSLLIADNRALFSFGLLAVAGELACVSAAILALPAILVLRDRMIRRTT